MSRPSALIARAPWARGVCSTRHKCEEQKMTTSAVMKTTKRSHPSRVGGGGGGATTTLVTTRRVRGTSLVMAATPRVARRSRPEPDDDDDDVVDVKSSSSSGASAEEVSSPSANKKVKPGYDADGNKLKWMEILEESAEYDPEIKDLLDGVDGDPNKVEERIRERFDKRKERVYQERKGSTVPMLVKFGEFKSNNLWVWVESHNKITDMEQPLLDEVFKAWFVLGKLGGFNSENMQVQSNFFEVSNMEYDMEMANSSEGDVPNCVFHAMVPCTWDVLINSLITFSREYFGLKTLVVGGDDVVEDWPVQESEFFVDDAGEMEIEMGPFRPPPPGTSVQGGMSR